MADRRMLHHTVEALVVVYDRLWQHPSHGTNYLKRNICLCAVIYCIAWYCYIYYINILYILYFQYQKLEPPHPSPLKLRPIENILTKLVSVAALR